MHLCSACDYSRSLVVRSETKIFFPSIYPWSTGKTRKTLMIRSLSKSDLIGFRVIAKQFRMRLCGGTVEHLQLIRVLRGVYNSVYEHRIVKEW